MPKHPLMRSGGIAEIVPPPRASPGPDGGDPHHADAARAAGRDRTSPGLSLSGDGLPGVWAAVPAGVIGVAGASCGAALADADGPTGREPLGRCADAPAA